MKLVRTTLLIATFILSACTTRAGQELGTKYQTSSYRRSQTKTLPSEHLPASYLARSVWGGFHLNLAMIGAASPSSSALFSSVTFSSSPSSPAQTCDSTEDFCILQHRFPFQRPFSPTFNTAIELSYLYGSTQFGDLAPHHGVEILNPTGTPVLAVGDGTVVVAGSDAHNTYGPWEDFYGNLVVLGHSLPGIEKPVFTLYGHLSEIAVQVGDTVKAGELIGEVGATGRAIGSHLHFEVRVGANRYENTRNPALWLIPRTDENGQHYGTLAGKLDNARGDPIDSTFKAEYYPDLNGLPDKIFYIETYATDIDPIGSEDEYQENFVLPDLPPGHYRIVLSASGKWTERWVEIEAGKLSFVTIVSK